MTESYFVDDLELKFKHYDLSFEDKSKINEIGKEFFEDGSIYFEVNVRSIRNDLSIKNLPKLFAGEGKGSKSRYEYVKEFILWEILKYIGHSKSDVQENNFFVTYIDYLLNLNPLALAPAKFKSFRR